MNRNLFSIFVLLFLGVSLSLFSCKGGDTPDPDPDPNDNPYGISVTKIPAFNVNESVTRDGDVQSGKVLPELDWAALSNVACFPATRFVEFRGKQVFYEVIIPQGTELIVTVTPTGTKERINLYGYIHFDGSNVPPLSSITSCEAGYEIYAGNPDLTKPGEPQSISFAQAVNRSFTALVAVSGAEGVESGTYAVEFALEPY